MSSRYPVRIRLARDLLRAESSSDADPVTAVRSILARMRQELIPILGSGGFAMLLRCATLRAASRCPALRELEIPERDLPGLESLERVAAASESDDPTVALVTLVGETLSLLARLLGWTEVLKLLEQPWPTVAGGYTVTELDVSSDVS